MSKKNVTVSLSESEIEMGKKQAKEKGLSFSTYIGQLIRAENESNK